MIPLIVRTIQPKDQPADPDLHGKTRDGKPIATRSAPNEKACHFPSFRLNPRNTAWYAAFTDNLIQYWLLKMPNTRWFVIAMKPVARQFAFVKSWQCDGIPSDCLNIRDYITFNDISNIDK
jgi:hypothetical protein